MQLFCDIGNTRIKAGIFKNDSLQELKIFENSNDFFEFINSTSFTDIAISSVVPSALNTVLKKLDKTISKNLLIINKDLKFNLTIDYDTPETLGIDRICSAEGAFYLSKRNKGFNNFKKDNSILTIDFGTATTINIIKFPNLFSGGAIAPGLDLMFTSLNKNTAQLPQVSHEDYINLIGRTTKQSIASGVLNSVVGLIEKIIAELSNESISEIYITGGNAKIILPFLSLKYIYEPALVLYGIKAIHQMNKDYKNKVG